MGVLQHFLHAQKYECIRIVLYAISIIWVSLNTFLSPMTERSIRWERLRGKNEKEAKKWKIMLCVYNISTRIIFILLKKKKTYIFVVLYHLRMSDFSKI